MSDAAALGAAEGNYFDAWRVLASRAPGGEVVESDELLFTALPVPVAYFNSAFVKPPTDPRACIEQVAAFYRERALPYTIRYRVDDSADAVAAACTAAGMTPDEGSPLMIAAIAHVDTAVPGDVRPVDADSWDAHVDTIAAGFGMPRDLLTGLVAPGLLDSGAYAGFIAYADGVPASTAALVVTGDMAGVYNVATPETFRRRGLGEAVTRAAVAEGARRGCTLTTLQASTMGYPIYERMGYRTIARWATFTGQR